MITITIRDSLYFTFNSQRSKDLKMLNVSLSGGMQQEYFASSQEILEQETRGRSKPYFQGVKKSPLTLNVEFAYEDQWTEDELRSLRRWLTEPTNYVPLTFSNNNEKIFYVLYVDNPELYHNSRSQGYITLTFRCNDAYAYSPIMTSPLYDWNEESQVINQDSFTSGTLHNAVLDVNEHITLNAGTFTWNDLPNDATWNDIFT